MCVAWMFIKLVSLCRSYGSVRLGRLSCNRLMILRTQMFLYVLIPIPNMPKPECTLMHLVNMQNMQNIHNMQNMQNSQNMKNRLNMKYMENMQNMHNM